MRKKHVVWIILGLLALVGGLLLRAFPQITEEVYGRGIFPLIRWIIGYSAAFLPFPAILLFFAAGLWLIWKTIVIPIRKHQWTLWSLIGGVLSTIGAAVFLFQFLWGFNYFRPTWDQRLGIETQVMTPVQLKDEFVRTTNQLKIFSATITDVSALDTLDNCEFERAVEPELRMVLERFHFPISKSPRVRIVRPKGILMRWATAGVYVPFVGEGHVDAGMLPVQIPFTLAHEMAHGFGVTDEGDCNFLAYLTCIASDDPHIRFAGQFTYWRYVASAFRMTNREEYDSVFDELPDLVKQLLTDIHKNDARYPDFLPKFRNMVYDTYLKSQGVHDGLYSYSRVVQLVWAYERKEDK